MAWNFGTLGPCWKRLERSKAVERLERLERDSLLPLPNAVGQLGRGSHGQRQRHHEGADDDESPDGDGVVPVQVEYDAHDQGTDDPRRNGSTLQKAQDSADGAGAEDGAAHGTTHRNEAAEADAEH